MFIFNESWQGEHDSIRFTARQQTAVPFYRYLNLSMSSTSVSQSVVLSISQYPLQSFYIYIGLEYCCSQTILINMDPSGQFNFVNIASDTVLILVGPDL